MFVQTCGHGVLRFCLPALDCSFLASPVCFVFLIVAYAHIWAVASSFIEEEHRIVYYFTTTVIAVALAAPALKRGDSRAIVLCLNFVKSLVRSFLTQSLFLFVVCSSQRCAALFIRVARSWYSGGDKFASLPGVATTYTPTITDVCVYCRVPLYDCYPRFCCSALTPACLSKYDPALFTFFRAFNLVLL